MKDASSFSTYIFCLKKIKLKFFFIWPGTKKFTHYDEINTVSVDGEEAGRVREYEDY